MDNLQVILLTLNYTCNNSAPRFKRINADTAISVTFGSVCHGDVKIITNNAAVLMSLVVPELRIKHFLLLT
jgi:hypothetical protein